MRVPAGAQRSRGSRREAGQRTWQQGRGPRGRRTHDDRRRVERHAHEESHVGVADLLHQPPLPLQHLANPAGQPDGCTAMEQTRAADGESGAGTEHVWHGSPPRHSSKGSSPPLESRCREALGRPRAASSPASSLMVTSVSCHRPSHTCGGRQAGGHARQQRQAGVSTRPVLETGRERCCCCRGHARRVLRRGLRVAWQHE